MLGNRTTTTQPTPTQGGTRFCTVKHCNRRLTSCVVVWDDAKAPETINLNHSSYRIVPEGAGVTTSSTDDDNDDDGAASSEEQESMHDTDDDAAPETPQHAFDVLQGTAAEATSALVGDAQHPELFVDVNMPLAQRARSVLQALYAYAGGAGDGLLSPTALQELHVGSDFDPEQVCGGDVRDGDVGEMWGVRCGGAVMGVHLQTIPPLTLCQSRTHIQTISPTSPHTLILPSLHPHLPTSSPMHISRHRSPQPTHKQIWLQLDMALSQPLENVGKRVQAMHADDVQLLDEDMEDALQGVFVQCALHVHS